MVTQDQAVEIAKKELAKHGHSVAEYALTVDPDNARATEWVIWFEKKGAFPIPGGRHAVFVNKDTGKPRFMVGE